MPTEIKIETFLWKGQLRYKCPMKWESGTPCEFDTFDLDQLKKHMNAGHSRVVGLKNEVIPPDLRQEQEFTKVSSPEFNSVEFKLEE